MDNESLNSLYASADRLIEASKIIEDLLKKVSEVELKYGLDSREYRAVSGCVIRALSLERITISKFIYSDMCIYFKNYIMNSNCSRLKDILNDDYDYNKAIITADSRHRYVREKDKIGKLISLDEYIKLDFNETGRHILRHTIFNLIQTKKYIEVADFYIRNTDDPYIKKTLVEEKYDMISRSYALQSWYFGLGTNLDWMLIDNDKAVAFQLGMLFDEYSKLKNDYMENAIEDYIDLIVNDSLESKDNRTIYEINILTALLCMNSESVSSSYSTIESDMEKNPSAYGEKSIEFIEKVYAKCPTIKNELKTKCPKEEVL